jgi:hypothetical protein
MNHHHHKAMSIKKLMVSEEVGQSNGQHSEGICHCSRINCCYHQYRPFDDDDDEMTSRKLQLRLCVEIL